MAGGRRLRWSRLGLFVAVAAAWCAIMATWQAWRDRSTTNLIARRQQLEQMLAERNLPVFDPWEQVAPFDRKLATPQDPETNAHPSAAYTLPNGRILRWRLVPDYLDGYVNSIVVDRITPTQLESQPTVYLARTIHAPQKTTIKAYLACDGGFALWLNGEAIFYSATSQVFQPGQEVAELPLVPGENRLLMKIKLAKTPCRFFFLPDFGQGVNETLLSELEERYPTGRELTTGYRQRAALQSADSEEAHYCLVEILTPAGMVLEGGGLDFMPDGRLAVSTRRGFVYLVENLGAENLEQIRFHRYAQGLHEGFGLKVVDGAVVVVERGGVTQLLDTDGDGQADRFENLCNNWGLTGNYHEYAYGLVQDERKNLYISLNTSDYFGKLDEHASPVPYRGWVLRISPRGEMEPFCYGFRSPNGLGTNAAGDIFVTDNQGQWVPASPLYHIRKDHFYGHPASIRWAKDESNEDEHPAAPTPTPPAVWMPYEELSQSATDIVCDRTGGKFGPFAGQLFVGDMTKGAIIRVALEKVGGEYQGACFPFRRGCGAVNRLAFGPEGHLYLARVNRGWGGHGRGDGLARIEFTGRTPLEVVSVELERDGFLLQFTKPLAVSPVLDTTEYRLEQFGYHYWAKYGSPKIHRELLKIDKVAMSADRMSLKIRTSGLRKDRVCHIRLPQSRAEDGTYLLHADAFYTINRLVE